ncbi:MAG TPA: hypothetical protein PLY56_09170 [Armatimonadota bacterium]|nr:hypothetical protein [Armatimonadota bacterium]HOJ21692.1 hypothetical protein [Armatimonadota bacterium]HOM80840.1 hypothetical protein [Armatimonadota bacterium]HOQ28734.1 hypothetical protein [Armatimonadota bacterium]HPO74666.1 hypothetical protein [Armatimonadota bacterium]
MSATSGGVGAFELPQRVLLRADEQGRFVALGNRVNLTRLLEMECQRASREDAPG